MVIDLEQTIAGGVDAGIANWQHFPASRISHHGTACCDVAREWLAGMDFSQLNGGNPLTGPRWLRKLFKWGPSKWPLHWCDAVRQKTLDCGALAALSHELFLARGVRSFPAQFILEFNDVSAQHWTATWGAAECSGHWMKEGLIYHEGCAVLTPENELKLWDATATWWVNSRQFGGYSGLLALRVFDDQAAQNGSFTWGAHRIVPNEWQKIAPAKADFIKTKPVRKAAAKRKPRARKKVVAPVVAA